MERKLPFRPLGDPNRPSGAARGELGEPLAADSETPKVRGAWSRAQSRSTFFLHVSSLRITEGASVRFGFEEVGSLALIAGVEVVSITELACWRRCPTEHHFRYVLRREKKGPPGQALTKGKATHVALGQHQRGETVDLSVLTPDIRALMRGYIAWYGTPDRSFAVEETDVPFQIQLPDGTTVMGEFDGVGVNRETGKRAIVEIKTSSEDISIGSPYWSRVALVDPQVTAYLLASRKMGWGQVEVFYDVLRKPNLRKKGDETEEEFEARILTDIIGRPEHYYQRATIVRLEHEHAAHLRDVSGTVRLMQVTREMGAPPRFVDSCFKYGRPCDFYMVCGGGADVMDETFFQTRASKKEAGFVAPAKTEGRYVF